jgi:hypothetical protein
MNAEFEKQNESIKGARKRKPRMSKARRADESLGSNVRLYLSTWELVRKLETDANNGGPRRVYARDILDAGIKKIVESDLEGLRKKRATIRDHFADRFKEFQSERSGASEEAFLAHLLGLSMKESNNQN